MKTSDKTKSAPSQPRRFMSAAPHLMVLAISMSGCSGSSDAPNAKLPDDDASLNSDADMGSGTNNSTDMSSPGDASDMPLQKSTIEMTINLIGFDTLRAAEGAKVCVLDALPENCAISDAAGEVRLRVPSGVDFAFTVDLETYDRTLFTMRAFDEDFALTDLIIATSAGSVALHDSIGVTQDPANGSMATFVLGEGVMPSLDPDVGEDFWYLVAPTDRMDAWIGRSDTGTPAAQSFPILLNLPPGDYRLRFDSEAGTCQTSGWEGDSPNEQRFTVRAGYHTALFTVDCL